MNIIEQKLKGFLDISGIESPKHIMDMLSLVGFKVNRKIQNIGIDYEYQIYFSDGAIKYIVKGDMYSGEYEIVKKQ